MDTGSGNINYLNKFEIAGVAGKLVSWEIGEEVEIKGCRFMVRDIKVFPANEITLVGRPNIKELNALCDKLPQDIFEESQHKIMDFVRKRKT